MKTKIKRLLSALICIMLLMSFVGCSDKNINISSNSSGKATFKTEKINVEKELSKEDVRTIAKIFDGKETYTDTVGGTASCGFSTDVSVTIDGKTYCFAMDGCFTVRTDLSYFDLSLEENNQLKAILKEYGFYFPCV